MRTLLSVTLTWLSLPLLANHAKADLLFSQPVIDGGVALASDFARAQQEADNFRLSQPSSVQTIHWWGAYANNAIGTDIFTLRLFADAAGNPAMAPLANLSGLTVTRTATNLLDNLGDTIYEYQAALVSPLTLDGATPYYLSLVNNTGDWDWVGSGVGSHWARQDDTGAWTVSSDTTDFSFELLGGTPVPEPATLLLLAIGVFGTFGWGWRRRRAWLRCSTRCSALMGQTAICGVTE